MLRRNDEKGRKQEKEEKVLPKAVGVCFLVEREERLSRIKNYSNKIFILRQSAPCLPLLGAMDNGGGGLRQLWEEGEGCLFLHV